VEKNTHRLLDLFDKASLKRSAISDQRSAVGGQRSSEKIQNTADRIQHLTTLALSPQSSVLRIFKLWVSASSEALLKLAL